MCGRFAQSQPLIHYAHAFDPAWVPAPLNLKATLNLAPGRRALVFHDTEFGPIAELLHWGFLPAWADPTSQKPINVAELVDELGRDVLEHARREFDCIDTRQLGNAREQVVQARPAGIRLEMGVGDRIGRRCFVSAIVVRVKVVTDQQSIKCDPAFGGQARMDGLL